MFTRETQTMKTTVLLSLFLFSLQLSAQHEVWEKWDQQVIDRANTAKEFSSFTDEEKKVVFFMNLARLDGPLFSETILDAYVEENFLDDNSYLKSLRRDLQKIKDLPLLIPEEDLTRIAQGHAEESGRTGHTGHKDFEKRFDPYIGKPYSSVAENCSYGFSDAVGIVIQLLVDDGVKSLGHRENTLNEEFNSVGIAIREHKTYNYNCVIDFGRKSRSSLNNAPL